MHIIDCVTRLVIPFPVEVVEYVALSYLWGPPIQKPRRLNECPKVIKDAILLACNLGFRYLWVDRYCIPQNDKHAKFIQIQNMGKIYANSTLTLIAAAGDDPDYGIPGVSSTLRSEEVSVKVGPYCLVGIHPPNKEILETKWSLRGWTYQEALLSKRRLVCTNSQVYFQCQSMHCTDNYSVDLLALHSSNGLFDETVNFGIAFPSIGKPHDQLSVSNRIVEYLNRDLSVDSDALNAITGVLGTYRELQNPVNFFCGLPIFPKASFTNGISMTITDILIEALLWDADDNLVRRPEFPSWSWAGWKRPENEKLKIEWLYRTHSPYSLHFNPEYLIDTVRMEFSDNTTLEWESHYRHIIEMSDAAIYPPISRLRDGHSTPRLLGINIRNF